jgi:hypothetical protein
LTVALPWLLLLALVVHVGAHVAIVVGFVGAREWTRAAIAFFVAPLAPVWGWRAGMHRRVYAWCAALAVYAVGVALA